MRFLSLLGLLIVVAIIVFWAKTAFKTELPTSQDAADRSTVEYWETHDAERQSQLAWCQQHSDQQDSGDCQRAVTAQTLIDAKSVPGH
jgi:hypothetical protein